MRYPNPAGWMGTGVGGKTRLTTVTEDEGFACRWGSGRGSEAGGSARSWLRRGRGTAQMRCEDAMRFPDSVVSCAQEG